MAPANPNFSRFDKTLEFMHREMVNNAKSEEVQEIKGLNSIVSGLLGGLANAGIRKTLALRKWKNLVQTNAKWDHKPKLRQMLNLGPDFHFPIRGDNEYEYYYDIWSNIHYGYVGMAAGFFETELQLGHQLGGSSGASDPVDVLTVQIGIDLWNHTELQLTKKDLTLEIMKRRTDLLKAQASPEYISAQEGGKDKTFRHIIPSSDGQ